MTALHGIQEKLQPDSMPQSVHPHVIFFVLAAMVIVLSFCLRIDGYATVSLPVIGYSLPTTCTSKIFLGIDCPACGMTRAFVAISEGNLSQAVSFNPASLIVYFFVLAQIPWQLYQIHRIRSGLPVIAHLSIYLIPAFVMLAMLGQWIWRWF